MALFFSAAQAATETVHEAAQELRADVHATEEAAGGLPQVDFNAFPSQIFWLLVALVVMYLMFTRVVLPRIGGIIEERHDAVEDDLDRAADYKRRAEEAEAAWQKALSDARAEAQAIADATKAEIQKEIDAAIEKADAEIAAKTAESEARIAEIRAEASAAVQEVAKDVAAALAEAVAPGAADASALNAAVSKRVEG